MGKPYADDLRLVVVRLIEEGHTRPEVAELCGISLSSVGRYIRRYRTTGSVSPDKFGGYKDYALAKYAERIKRWIAKQPDLTLLELQARPFCVFALDGIDSPRSSEQVRLMHGVSRLIASLAIKAIAGRR